MSILGGGETVIVQRADIVTDRYSGEQTETSWDAVTEHTIAHVLCEPRPTSEPLQDHRNSVVSGWTLYLPAGSDITPQDRVVVRGLTHEVLGELADWRFGRWRPGVVVQCQRVEG